MNKRKIWFTLAVAFQMVVLIVIAGSFYAIDVFGKEVTLTTEPVDPRDLFYGDYVILRYDIQTLDQSLWKEAKEPERNQKVFVKLEPDGAIYTASGIYAHKPATASHEIVMQARFLYERSFNHEYFFDYGLERYYIPEGTGQDIEEQREGMTVDILIAPWGQAKIKQLNFAE